MTINLVETSNNEIKTVRSFFMGYRYWGSFGLGSYKEITGKDAQKKLNLTSGAIVYSLRALENMDYVERINTYSFRIISPVIRSTLEMFYKEFV